MKTENEMNDFVSSVNILLQNSDVVIVKASELTSFEWNSLCIKRKDTLNLNFQGNDENIVLILSYEEFFVDEGYVKGSIDGKCINPNTKVKLKRKYPGYSQIVELQLVGEME